MRSAWISGVSLAAVTTVLFPCAFAQPARDAHSQKALIAAVKEMVEELKARTSPDKLGPVGILPLEEPIAGATEAGDYVRVELETALSQAGFRLVARDQKAESKLFLEPCRSASGHTSDESAKSFGEQVAADSMIFGHIDKLSREWRISIRVVLTDSTVVPLVTRRFVPLDSIPKDYEGHRLRAAAAACPDATGTPDEPVAAAFKADTPQRRPPLRVAVMPWGGFAGGCGTTAGSRRPIRRGSVSGFASSRSRASSSLSGCGKPARSTSYG